ncbi:MAG: hypothetical protein AB7D29_08930 [Campylobacterales bacterium]
MFKKLILTAALAVSFAFAGPCCKIADSNATRACDTNATVAKCNLGKNCPCGAECKCGDNCKCKPMKKSKKAKKGCEGNCSK